MVLEGGKLSFSTHFYIYWHRRTKFEQPEVIIMHFHMRYPNAEPLLKAPFKDKFAFFFGGRVAHLGLICSLLVSKCLLLIKKNSTGQHNGQRGWETEFQVQNFTHGGKIYQSMFQNFKDIPDINYLLYAKSNFFLEEQKCKICQSSA